MQTPLTFIDAETAILRKVFSPYDIQSFINWRPQWSESKQKWLKRPMQNINKPDSHLSLDKAIQQSPTVGLVCSDAHNIIALDIDGVPLDHQTLKYLVSNHPSYTEQSPSGKEHHLRILYEVDDKSLLKKKATVTPEGQDKQIELYSASTNYVTLTGHVINDLPIAKIKAEQLIKVFNKFENTNVVSIEEHPNFNSLNKASLTPANVWLAEVPAHRDDPLLQSFCHKHGLVYHDYWLLGIMAIRAAHGGVNGYGIADQWSQLTGDDYDQDELQARWTTIDDPDYNPPTDILPHQHQEITEATYQWMFNEFSIQWPILKGKTKIPKPDELENFLAFLEYKGITIAIDEMTGTLFFDGEDHALYPTYYESKEHAYATDTGDFERLAACLTMEAHAYKFRPTSTQVQSWIKDILLSRPKKINRFAREIASRPAYDPDNEPDYIKIIAEDIIQRNPECGAPSQEFHGLLVRKWLLSMGRSLWCDVNNPRRLPATSEGVLILSSPKGGINKSSFGIRLFPPEWRHLHVTTKPRLSGQFADKDSVQKTVGKLIVDFDEAERIFSHNDTADLKAYLTERYDLFRPPYGRDQVKHVRYFSCMASTNLTDLVFPREGARRYWWLNVDYVDTYAMDEMDMYNLWRQIYHEIKSHTGQRAPYILKAAETKYLESYLVDHTTSNSVEEILMDIFDFSEQGFNHYKDGRNQGVVKLSMSLNEVSNILISHGQKTTPKALKHALVTMLKKYAPPIVVSTKKIKDGVHITRRQLRYFMPVQRFDELKKAEELD